MTPHTASPGADFDVLVIGGGINGAGIARDAAGRGLKVCLCEQHDLAAHTSSASTKLIHGGLRYLEHLHFGLVRKALREREVLMALAPHLIQPLRFILPHVPQLRPAWLIRCGLFLYDHLAMRRALPGSTRLRLGAHPAGAPLRADYGTAFTYYDAWVDDARLVVLNALSAAERGAVVHTYRRVSELRECDGIWFAETVGSDGSARRISARAIVNAGGPWAVELRRAAGLDDGTHDLRLVKGSHIIVPRLFDHPDAYILQATDRRVVFAIPYENDFTMIGTTDIDYSGAPERVAIDAGERKYLCDQANHYFRRQIEPRDIVHTFSGVRPLLEDESADASSATRDYELEMAGTSAPFLTVFGGKITTYRVLAEQAVDLLVARLGSGRSSWTARAPLPGGDLPGGALQTALPQYAQRYPTLPQALLQRWLRAYGSRLERMLEEGGGAQALGAEVLPGLHEIEIRYLRRTEFARRADDILWRRSKLGLHQSADATQVLQDWIDRHPGEMP